VFKEYIKSGYSVAVPMDSIMKLIDEEFVTEIDIKEEDFPDEIKEQVNNFRDLFRGKK